MLGQTPGVPFLLSREVHVTERVDTRLVWMTGRLFLKISALPSRVGVLVQTSLLHTRSRPLSRHRCRALRYQEMPKSRGSGSALRTCHSPNSAALISYRPREAFAPAASTVVVVEVIRRIDNTEHRYPNSNPRFCHGKRMPSWSKFESSFSLTVKSKFGGGGHTVTR